MALELSVSFSALFYTMDEKSLDESDFSKIDSILEEEIQNFLKSSKSKIRNLK